jgi:PEP-CTERM motif
MRLLPLLRPGFAALALVAAAPTQALDIQVSFATSGQFSALAAGTRFVGAFGSSLSGGGSFASVVQAAAGTWESLLQDERTVNITFGWGSLGSSTVAHALVGGDSVNEIVFNRALTHYADPTPLDSDEFGGFAQHQADLGGGLVYTSRGYTSGPGRDLYTTALHEIGHVLGNPFNAPQGAGAASFVVASGPFAGTSLACDDTLCTHLEQAGTLMNPVGGADLYRRTLVSGADLLYVATDGGYTQFNRALVGPVPEPASALLLVAGLAGLALRTRQRRA